MLPEVSEFFPPPPAPQRGFPHAPRGGEDTYGRGPGEPYNPADYDLRTPPEELPGAAPRALPPPSSSRQLEEPKQ